jgi:DNA-directed RNA polymerase specialized sigma24 family protein
MGHLLTSPDGSKMIDLGAFLKEIKESLQPGEDQTSFPELSLASVRSIIYCLRGIRRSRRKSDDGAEANLDAREAFMYPRGFAFEPWKLFRQKARPEELDAVLFCHIFALPEEKLAEALFVSPGTVRNRLTHGLMKLGDALHVHRTVLNRL